MTTKISIAPSGEKHLLPTKQDYETEFQRLEELVKEQKQLNREIVVVMGLGFVGAVMAAVIANAEDASGKPSKFVIGIQRPSVRSYWKIKMINDGLPPFNTEDPKVAQLIHNCVVQKKNLVATFTEKALELADVVVVDIQCDYHKDSLGDVENGHVEIDDFVDAIYTVGLHIKPSTLVLIETTVPPGTTEHIAYPIMKSQFAKRGIKSSQNTVFEPLLSHSYERVMPGKQYVDSIRNFWRVCSGINEESREKVVKFLNEVLNTKDYPLTVMDRPIESETAKIMENSYRATLLAFADEWSLFAEQNGVDITKVIKAIKVRPTHSNIMFPGPGIGGYCLPKDGALGMWAYKNILGGKENILKLSTQAININDTRPLHAVEMLQDALLKKGLTIDGLKITVLGASYREDVGDTRYSGSEIIVRKLTELGAEVRVHDPYVESWPELEAGNGRSIFFKNQEQLTELKISHDLDDSLDGAEAIILAVRHQPYLELFPDEVVNKTRKPPVILDCFGILTDKQIRRYIELGCVVKGLGRGHIETLNNPRHMVAIARSPKIEISRQTKLKIIAAIPCYNTEGTIADVISKTKLYVDEVIVIDDGSQDNTASAAKEAGARVISHKTNHGKGAAMKTAMTHTNCDILLFIDGDGQHDPNDIPELVKPIILDQADFVIGSRYCKGSSLSANPFLRKAANTAASMAISLIISCVRPIHMGTKRKSLEIPGARILNKRIKWITDCTSGFTAVKRENCNNVHLISDGFQIETEMIFEQAKNGFIIAEVPISCKWGESISKLSIIKDATRTFAMLLKKLTESRNPKSHVKRNILIFSTLTILILVFILITNIFN